jgi:hypothetical protein
MSRKEAAAPISVKHFSVHDRKVWVLIAIVAVTLYVFATQWRGPAPAPAPARPAQPSGKKSELARIEAAPQAGSSRRVSSTKTDPLSSADPSLMPELQVTPKSFDQEKRNLFAFFVPPPPPPPPPPAPECGDGMCNGKETWETCPADCPKPPPPPVCGDKRCEGNENYQNCPADCEPPPPPEITLKYIGYMSDSLGPVAFLTDGKEVYMGRVNDIIANRYRVVSISEDGVELGYVNLKAGLSKRIPFQGNAKS